MKRVLVLGGGKVGKSVAELLLACGGGNYRVTLADRDEKNLREAENNLEHLKTSVPHAIEFTTKRIDAAKADEVRAALTGQDYVICMLPFNLVSGVAKIANELGVHYFDVTEDVAATEGVKRIAESGNAKVALVPQCGLAPGYIAIAAYDVAKAFSEIHDLTLRVGALPQYTTKPLKYNVTWSAAGVVNEYCEPCNVMLGGRQVKVPALEGLELFSFEGIDYEAFYTSGGIGSLIDSLTSEKKTIDESRISYKTIRYPGHRDLMKFLLEDLRLGVEHAKPSVNGRGVRPLARGGPAGARDRADAAGRGGGVHQLRGREGGAAGAGELPAHDSRDEAAGAHLAGDRADDGGGGVRDGGPAPAREAAAEGVHPAGGSVACGLQQHAVWAGV